MAKFHVQARLHAGTGAPSQDEMTSGLGNSIDGDLLATELRRLPADDSESGGICANGTPSLVYQLSLGMLDTSWR